MKPKLKVLEQDITTDTRNGQVSDVMTGKIDKFSLDALIDLSNQLPEMSRLYIATLCYHLIAQK